MAERENVGIQTLAITIAAVRYGASVKAMLDQMAYGLLTQGTLREFILAYTASIYSGAETGDLDYQDSGATTPAVADNDPVGLITDVSANANHPFASGGSRPVLKTNIVNGHPVWRFDGTRTMQFTGSGGFSNDGASFSYFAVVKPADRSGDYAILGAVATARVWRINSGTGYQNLEYSFISSVATSLSPVPLDRFSIVGVTYDHPTGTVTFWLNGQQDGQFVVTPVTFQNGTAYLGSRGGSDLFFNGDIAAYEKSTAVFADLQRQQLLLHWNEKFALEATGESPDIALAAAALQLRPRALAGIL
jgi:hypothetical protein